MTSIDPNKKTGIELSEIMLDQSIYKHPMMFKMIIASSVWLLQFASHLFT